MAVAACNDITTAANLVANQNAIIRDTMITTIALKSPWANLLPSGTVENNIGENITSLVTPRANINQSLTTPVFGDLSASCGSNGEQTQWGQYQYVTKLQLLRGRSQDICVNAARFTVINSFRSAVESLKQEILELWNADVRAQVRDLSGVKAVILASDDTVTEALTGGIWQTSAAWRGVVPTARLTFSWLKQLWNYAVARLSPELLGSGMDQYAVFVGSSEIIDSLRNEAGVNSALVAATTGGYTKDGKDALFNPLWIDSNFRGIKMAVDYVPLRFNALDGDGAPDYIDPYTTGSADYGYTAGNNSTWDNAQYEIGFLVFKNAFKRLVPQRYVGEGEMKFGDQLFGGQLQWIYRLDNNCNVWGDFGHFQYQIARAYESLRPMTIIPIAYKRCAYDLGLSTCGDFTG